MKKSLICVFLLLTIVTALPAQTPSLLPLSLDRSQLKEIHCKTEAVPSTQPQSARYQSPSATLSTNWCGYVALTSLKKPKKNSVSMVSGAWIVPKLTATANDSYSSIWVGMDGFSNNSQTVEQIGTEQDFIGGVQTNFAWFEIFPGPEFELVGFPVNTGDLMGGEVAFVDDDKFILYIMNFTVGVFTAIPVHVPDAKRNSADWIVEAPSINNSIAPLANFGVIPFVQCTAKIDGDVGSISDDDWKNEAIIMVSQANTPKAIPTTLKKDGESFFVAWQSEGP